MRFIRKNGRIIPIKDKKDKDEEANYKSLQHTKKYSAIGAGIAGLGASIPGIGEFFDKKILAKSAEVKHKATYQALSRLGLKSGIKYGLLGAALGGFIGAGIGSNKDADIESRIIAKRGFRKSTNKGKK